MMGLFGKTGVPGAPPSPYYPVGQDCLLYHVYRSGAAVDRGPHANDGTVIGASFGPTGLTFDGLTNKVTFNPINLGKLAATVYIWLNSTFIASYQAIIARQTGGLAYFPLIEDNNYVYIWSDYTGPGEFATTGWIMAQGWLLCQVVYDGSQAKIYKNASPYGSHAGAFTADLILSQIGISGPSAYPFKGIIDEVLIFNTAKSEQDLLDYYNATKDTPR